MRILMERAANIHISSEPPHTKKWHVWLQRGVCSLSLTYLVVMIEATIRWNKLQGVHSVNSVGQIIPLVVGITCLVQVLYAVTICRAKVKTREERYVLDIQT
ncbi:hypothetical protein GGS24DRAFT_452081 [Hypoxylon argillaceum]|nr:hypothetical protein GGS24DRAFT_452081 [Hypoxylon argillaceum]